MKRIIFFINLLFILLTLFSCTKDESKSVNKSVAVFVPGMTSGSPIYAMLADGAKKASDAVSGTKIKIIEAGYDQSKWFETLRSIAASGQFDIIVSSNPSLPDLCARLTTDYPNIKYILVDAWMHGNKNIHTVLYNQKEQGYIVGYLAGLYMKKQGTAKNAAIIIAQHYPTLDKLIIPGYEAGLKAVDNNFELLIREIGNWYDSAKASELARALYDGGVDVILPIAGAASQGIISAAKERNKKLVWFDAPSYSTDTNVVIGCATIAHDKLVEKQLLAALNGEITYGNAEIVFAHDGFIGFDSTSAGYNNLPESMRQKFMQELELIKNGKVDLFIKGL